jgi:catechol 2,3-dioxygenase-like lactoylglutathione lyase family enzyme
MEMKHALVPIPVAGVDRAKTFYVERLGFVASKKSTISS